MRSKPHVEGAETPASNAPLRPVVVDFGPGDGYVEKTLKITW
jgi:hypothetical protein